MRLKSCQVFFHRHQATERSSVLWLLLYVPLQAFHIILLYHFGARCLPNMGKHVTPLGHVCCTDVAHLSPIWQTPFGLKQNPACPCFCDELRVSVPPPKGRDRYSATEFSQSLQPPPSLPRRGGTDTLLCQRLLDAGYSS